MIARFWQRLSVAPTTVQLLLPVVLFLTSLALGSLLMWLPEQRENQRLRSQYAALEDELGGLHRRLRQLSDDQQRRQRRQRHYRQQLQQLPDNAENEAFTRSLSELTRRHNMQLHSYAPGTQIIGPFYRRRSLDVELRGHYRDLMALSDELHTDRRPLEITGFDLKPVAGSGQPPRFGIRLRMNNYCCAADNTPTDSIDEPAVADPASVFEPLPAVKSGTEDSSSAVPPVPEGTPPLRAIPKLLVLPVRFAEAGQLAKVLQQAVAGTGSRITVDLRTNALVVQADAAARNQLIETLEQLDVPVRQVLIEALIASVRTNFAEQLGINWELDVQSGGQDVADRLLIESENSLIGGLELGFIGDHARLKLALQAMSSSGQGEILSRPRLITGDRQSAEIKSGTRIPFQESAPNGRTTIRFEDAVLSLKFTPIITPADKILLTLMINQDAPGTAVDTGEGRATSIDTTELSTRVLLQEGQTVALGGVFREEETLTRSKIPGLGRIPILGRLFRRNTDSRIKTETLIFITPHILPGE